MHVVIILLQVEPKFLFLGANLFDKNQNQLSLLRALHNLLLAHIHRLRLLLLEDPHSHDSRLGSGVHAD